MLLDKKVSLLPVIGHKGFSNSCYCTEGLTFTSYWTEGSYFYQLLDRRVSLFQLFDRWSPYLPAAIGQTCLNINCLHLQSTALNLSTCSSSNLLCSGSSSILATHAGATYAARGLILMQLTLFEELLHITSYWTDRSPYYLLSKIRPFLLKRGISFKPK